MEGQISYRCLEVEQILGLNPYAEGKDSLVVSSIINVIPLTLLPLVEGTTFSVSASPIKPHFLSS
jgi:hypothetical protein